MCEEHYNTGKMQVWKQTNTLTNNIKEIALNNYKYVSDKVRQKLIFLHFDNYYFCNGIKNNNKHK